MIHVRLFCGAGMSTSLLARKMTEYAASKGIEAVVDAKPTSYIKSNDMGFKLGCGLEWNNLYVEAAYQFGVLNIVDYDTDNFSSHGHAFAVNIGVNF